MSIPVRLWHLLVIPLIVGVGIWMLLPSDPPPPDFTDQRFTSIRVELSGRGEEKQPVSASSSDASVVAELVDILRSGRSVMVCRCAALGTLEFLRPDGSSEKIFLMPTHDGGSVEFRAGPGRYRVERARFLRATSSLNIPPGRWYTWPLQVKPAD